MTARRPVVGMVSQAACSRADKAGPTGEEIAARCVASMAGQSPARAGRTCQTSLWL
ncbi:hypothetical protein [Paraburkholderia sp. J63]|uniref:hypothetical protein n=1 Tax=Paraburkholderia sp. J63 TaxID=2805434 RepID=UPI002ABDE231|nr:hypothetical protein [Paraburkholderia sp. J63]